MSEEKIRKIAWNDVYLLEEQKNIIESKLNKAHEINRVNRECGKPFIFTLGAELLLGKMKSQLAELKGEKRNIVKCSICGADIDLDNDFDCWKQGDNYSCIGCGINDFMGMKNKNGN